MKLKLKMDKRALLEFLVQHVEKIVFTVAMVCFVLIVYRATTRGAAPMTPSQQVATPDQLAAEADRAKQSWEKTVRNPPVVGPGGIGELVEIIGQDLIESNFLPPSGPFAIKPELFPQRRQRIEPPVYTVAKLRAAADFGRVPAPAPIEAAAAPLDAGVLVLDQSSTVRGLRWVVLTALVPVEKQTQAYQESFLTAQIKTANDLPLYAGYMVQRVEVGADGAGGPIDWNESPPFYSGQARLKAQTMWSDTAGAATEVVDPKYIDATLGFSLPPVLEPHWDASVAHEPEIPLLRSTTGGALTPDVPATGGPEDPLDPFGGVPRDAVTTPQPGPAVVATAAVDRPAENRLFRFFDLTIEPGKRYRYRVSLVLRNPNDGVAEGFLSPEVLDKKRQIEKRVEEETAKGNAAMAAEILREWQYLQSEWSEPSPVISVPRESRLLALGVQPSRSARVLLVRWLPEEGVEAFAQRNVERGQVANFPGCRFPETSTGGRRGAVGGGNVGVPVDYMTETLVLDIDGGRMLPGRDRLSQPGVIAVLGPDGSVQVRRESDDLVECDRFLQSDVEEKAVGGQPPPVFGAAGNLDALRRGRAGAPPMGQSPPGGRR